MEMRLITSVLVEFLNNNEFMVNSECLELNQYNSNGETPLLTAVRLNNLLIVVEIIKHDLNTLDPNASRTFDGATPLIVAAQEGFLDIVQELLEIPQLNVNAQDQQGQTALYVSVKRGQRSIILEIIENGKHEVVDMYSFDNKNAEDIAIEKGYKDIAENIQTKTKKKYIGVEL